MKVLTAPLDWGLGHATRLLPLLRQWQAAGAELIIGVNDSTKAFLQAQLPTATFEEVPSYNISYAQDGFDVMTGLRLLPHIFRAIRQERKVVDKLVAKYQPQLIVSDNRFGFRHPQVQSIIISHQLNLQYSKNLSLFGKIGQRFNERWLQKFDKIWVPDTEAHTLSGILSQHPTIKAKPIGYLSRFESQNYPKPITKDYMLCIVSGPEPLRSALENIFRAEAETHQQQIVLLGGRPFAPHESKDSKYVQYFSHLPDEDFAAYLQHANCVVSRSGYSSLMDYIAIGCQRVFLIPTPGQSEQEYLANRLQKQGVCNYSIQNDFSFVKVLDIDWQQWKGFAHLQTNLEYAFCRDRENVII